MKVGSIRKQTLEMLKDKYGEPLSIELAFIGIAFIAYILLFAIVSLFHLNSTVTRILSSLMNLSVMGTIGFGISSFYLKFSRGEQVTVKEMFNKTDMFMEYILLSVTMGLFIALWSLLFIIPGIIASISYMMAYYIKLDNPNIGTFDAIRRSKELMRGNKMDFCNLQLSFMGVLLIACIIPFLGLAPILLIVYQIILVVLALRIGPQIQLASAVFYNELLKKNNSVKKFDFSNNVQNNQMNNSNYGQNNQMNNSNYGQNNQMNNLNNNQ